MIDVLLTSMALGSGTAITIAALERKPRDEIELWGFWGTAVGFLIGLFLVICCPSSYDSRTQELCCRQ